MKISKLKKGDIAFIIVIVLVVSIAILGLLACVPLKQKIDKSIAGLCWNIHNLEDYSDATIELEGYYYNYVIELWNTDYYEGSMKISGDDNYELEWIKASFIQSDAPDGTKYNYAIFDDILDKNAFSGYIYVNNNRSLSELIISPNGESKQRYAFPATNINEAEALDMKLNATRWTSDTQ